MYIYIHDDCKKYRCEHYRKKKHIKQELIYNYYNRYEDIENKINNLEYVFFRETTKKNNTFKDDYDDYDDDQSII